MCGCLGMPHKHGSFPLLPFSLPSPTTHPPLWEERLQCALSPRPALLARQTGKRWWGHDYACVGVCGDAPTLLCVTWGAEAGPVQCPLPITVQLCRAFILHRWAICQGPLVTGRHLLPWQGHTLWDRTIQSSSLSDPRQDGHCTLWWGNLVPWFTYHFPSHGACFYHPPPPYLHLQ